MRRFRSFRRRRFGRPSRFRRRRFGRRFGRRKSRLITIRQRTTQPIAPRTLARLKYATTVNLTISTGGIPVYYFMNLNSLFDPDRTSVGHQPYGFDFYSNLYNRYRVYKVHWAVEFPSFPSAFYSACCTPQNHANPPASFDAGSEQPRTITKSVSGGGKSQVIKGTAYLPALNGNTPQQYRANEDTSASFVSSPNEVITLRIGANNPTSSTAINGVSIRMVYFAELFDPIDLTQS